MAANKVNRKDKNLHEPAPVDSCSYVKGELVRCLLVDLDLLSMVPEYRYVTW